MGDTIHIFERANLGKAPFMFIGISVKTYQSCPEAPVQPAGMCDYCGASIMECCFIRDANGKTFIVGNTCVNKTGDEGLVKATKIAVNTARRVLKEKKDLEKIQMIKEFFSQEDVQAKLKAIPHPNWPNRNMLQQVTWLMANSGRAGKIRTYKMAKGLIERKVA